MKTKRSERMKVFNKVAMDASKINHGQKVTDSDFLNLPCLTELDRHDWRLDPSTYTRGNGYACDKCGAKWDSNVG